MISTYLTSVTSKFSPFKKGPHAMARIFLSCLPPNARSNIKINVTQMPRVSEEAAFLSLTFKDGKEMKFGSDAKLKVVMSEVDRHSRMLARKDDLTSG